MHHRSGRSQALSRALVAAAVALFALGPLGASEPSAGAEERAKGGAKKPGKTCMPQRPQKFLERRTFMQDGMVDPGKHARAVRYLAEHYGHVESEATRRWNGEGALSHAKNVKFMGLPISVHESVAPALACVEKRIAKTCGGKASRYTPRAVGGFRTANTYRGVEISNHLFGIALDIDPDRNPCCGCVDPWPTSPLCKLPAATPYQRTALPRCWINAFERYGFDWLGHDALEDTMHFEFLGDPGKIMR